MPTIDGNQIIDWHTLTLCWHHSTNSIQHPGSVSDCVRIAVGTARRFRRFRPPRAPSATPQHVTAPAAIRSHKLADSERPPSAHQVFPSFGPIKSIRPVGPIGPTPFQRSQATIGLTHSRQDATAMSPETMPLMQNPNRLARLSDLDTVSVRPC